MNIKAYAKVNLDLRVLGKRSDGFHEISSLMHAVNLFDEVKVSAERKVDSGSVNIKLETDGNLPCDSKNLAYRAAEAFADRTGFEGDINISIKKHIPIAAGLAGGSADAAAVLNALGSLLATEDSVLYELASDIGSDVSFCLAAQKGKPCCLCTGRGEKLVPHRTFDFNLIILTPDIEVSTKEVYQNLKETEYTSSPSKWYDDGSLDVSKCGNDLENASIRLFPEEKDCMEELAKLGKADLILLSGSGPTVFGLYERKESLPIGVFPAETPKEAELAASNLSLLISGKYRYAGCHRLLSEKKVRYLDI